MITIGIAGFAWMTKRPSARRPVIHVVRRHTITAVCGESAGHWSIVLGSRLDSCEPCPSCAEIILNRKLIKNDRTPIARRYRGSSRRGSDSVRLNGRRPGSVGSRRSA